MKRSKRLMALMNILKGGAVHRAEDLAQTMHVSVRTIYRDMDTMVASGLPIEGERGVGYSAKAITTLPPINVTQDELEALHLGLAAIATSMDTEVKAAAESLSAKLDAALPEDIQGPGENFGFATYPFSGAVEGLGHLNRLRSAIRARQRLNVRMLDGTLHDIRPLKIEYWGRAWSLITYSETSETFVSLRVDLVESVSILPGLFVEEPGKGLSDFRRN